MNRYSWMAGLCAVAFAGVGAGQTLTLPAGKPVAVVNGVQISQAALDAALRSAGPAPLHMPEAQRRRRQMEALSMLIDGVLMRQFLEKNTPPVPEGEVARRMAELEDGLRRQDKSLAEFCQDTNQTLEQLRGSVLEHIRWNAYIATNVSEAAVRKYYDENRDFFDEVTVRASHIVIRLPANATETEKAQARQTLEKVREQLRTDPRADFDALAKQWSHDPQAAKGGDLGWIPRKWFDEAFARAAFALNPGEVSGVVQTDFGLHLIKVTDRKPGKPSEFEKIKEGVREFCAEDLRQQILNHERETARKAGALQINLP